MKKVAVLNDLSGLGKCSLTAAIPVLSVMGVQACPLPTAVLSAQTGFSSYYYDDYTRHIEEIIREWKKMDFCPDGIYTGFLAGDIQAERVLDFVKEFQQKDTKVLVDPVLGDNGEEYPMYTESLCGRMRCLAKRASIITPNLTEALLLLYGQDKMHEIWADLTKTVKNRTQESAEETKKKSAKADRKCFEETVEQIGTALAEQFQTEVVITGIDIPQEDGGMKIGNLICREDCAEWIVSLKEGGSYSGTGDLFASVLCAGMVKGTDTALSVKKAVQFLSKAIHDTVLEGTDRNEGVCFETYLHELY